MKSTSSQLVTWHRLEDYSTIHPTRSGVVLLAVTNLKTTYSDIADGQISWDDEGNLQWSIHSINGVGMYALESQYGLKKEDYRLDYWADVLCHPRYLDKLESAQ